MKRSRRLRKPRHPLPSVIGKRRCASAFSAALLFATSITQVHLGRLRRRRKCQTHHLPSFRNKWRAPNLVGARLVPLPAWLRRSAQPFASPWKSMCETPTSQCRCLSLREDLVGEAEPFTQGSRQVERRGEASCLPADYSRQHEVLENPHSSRKTHLKIHFRIWSSLYWSIEYQAGGSSTTRLMWIALNETTCQRWSPQQKTNVQLGSFPRAEIREN